MRKPELRGLVMWECPECGKSFHQSGQSHSCVVVPLEAHFPPGKEHARRLFDRVYDLIRTSDPQARLSIARTRIGFINGITFAAVNRVGREVLDMHLLLGRRDEGGFVWRKIDSLGVCQVHHATVREEALCDASFKRAVHESVRYGQRRVSSS